MLSPQAGAVLLNTFSSMQKKCFNYFELNWKFICKRVIFKKYQHCFSPNSEWILSFKKKEKKKKKTPQSALTCVAGGIRVDVFPFFSRLIAKFIPLVLSAWRTSYAGYQRIESLSADPEFEKCSDQQQVYFFLSVVPSSILRTENIYCTWG